MIQKIPTFCKSGFLRVRSIQDVFGLQRFVRPVLRLEDYCRFEDFQIMPLADGYLNPVAALVPVQTEPGRFPANAVPPTAEPLQ